MVLQFRCTVPMVLTFAPRGTTYASNLEWPPRIGSVARLPNLRALYEGLELVSHFKQKVLLAATSIAVLIVAVRGYGDFNTWQRDSLVCLSETHKTSVEV